jgi:hypothetical protein
MATTKKVRILDKAGNVLQPLTHSSIVVNDKGENLGTVEAGAQVNKIEKITINGKELSVVSKTVDITIDQATYSIAKQETAESGYSATYQLTKDGTAVGEKINIPKDLVVKSGSVIEKDGEKYIQLIIANDEESPIEVAVSDLVDIYTAGTGIIVTNNEISVDTDTLKQTFAQVGDSYTKAESDNKYLTEHQDISGKQDKLSEAQLSAVNSGITSAKVSVYDAYATTIANKADASNVYSKTEIDNMNLLTYEEIV